MYEFQNKPKSFAETKSCASLCFSEVIASFKTVEFHGYFSDNSEKGSSLRKINKEPQTKLKSVSNIYISDVALANFSAPF